MIFGTILEIGLTAWAWQRGWKALALLPVAVFYGLVLLMGLAVGLANGNSDSAMPLVVVLGLVKLGVLGWMIARKAQPVLQPVPVQVSSPKSTRSAW